MAALARIDVVGDGDVARARAAAREAMAGRSDDAVYAAELVTTELVTNALLHGGGIATFEVWPTELGARIEVSDRNRHAPLVAVTSLDAMTGRGLHLVSTFAAAWGVRPLDDGKVVWADVADTAPAVAAQSEEDLLAAWNDPFDAAPAGTVHLALGEVPTELLVAAKRHVDNLVREFALASSGERSGTTSPVPAPLAELIDEVVHGFADARRELKRQATEAARAGASHTFVELDLPVGAANAAEAYIAALDEADEYCRANRLLTLETPPQHRVFRHWYIGEIVKQLRAVAAGEPRPPVVPFEQRLLEEVDASERARRAAERAARLYRVGIALANAQTPEEVADAVLQDGVDALRASGGGVLLASTPERVEVPGTVGYSEPVVQRLREESPDAELPAAYALRTGEAVWLETVEERDRRFPALAGMEPTTVAMCAVPLKASSGVLGALRFSFDDRRLFDDDEQQFVLALAAEAAEAFERAQLLRREHEARVRLERERASLEKFAAVGEAMLRGRDLETILQLATEAGTQITGAQVGAFVYNTPGGGEHPQLHTLSGVAREEFAGFPMPRDTASFGGAFLGAGATRLDDVTADPAYREPAPGDGEPDGRLRVRSYLAVPVTLSSGDVVGGLFFGHAEPGRFSADAERLAAGVAGQAAAAIENVRSLEERTRVASILQRSLLPPALPAVPGAEVAAVYETGGDGVGGDFYDIFPLDGGRWGLAMGDVRGRGPHAAALTSLARYTIRTAAMLGRSPAEVMSVLNAAVYAEDDDEQFCSAVFAVLAIGDGGATLTYASAGHPPLAILRRAGVDLVPPTAPLAGVVRAFAAAERVVRLASGEAVVLYTDGISEARAGDEEFGERRLLESLDALRGRSADEVAEGLAASARTFASGSPTDDAAVFVAVIR